MGRRAAVALVALASLFGCAGDTGSAPPSTTAPPPTTTSTTSTTTTTTTTTTPSPTSTTSSTTSTTTTTTTTTSVVDPSVLGATFVTFGNLAAGVEAAQISIWRDGRPVFGGASGVDRSGAPLRTDSPMVIASVSKLITALTIARLAQGGVVDVGAAVPWAEMGFPTDPAWSEVTVRELLDHTSGMPVARQSWLDDPGTCAEPLSFLLRSPPTGERGGWRYSNGNYCALGLLVEHLTGERYDAAARSLVLEPVGVSTARLTVDGPAPGDGPYRRGIDRFDRLGAAGSWLASTDDVVAVLASVTEADLETLRWPGIFLDEFGWGHTGTVAGARSCAWVIEDARTIVAVTVAGERPAVGGGLCDLVLPALAFDLGLGDVAGVEPERSPPSPRPGTVAVAPAARLTDPP